jgi:hypothetical protein
LLGIRCFSKDAPAQNDIHNGEFDTTTPILFFSGVAYEVDKQKAQFCRFRITLSTGEQPYAEIRTGTEP